MRLLPDVTAYRFRHRDNWPFVVLWNKKPERKLTLKVPVSVTVADLFGNPVHGMPQLTDRPLFLYPGDGKGENWIRQVQLLPEK